MIYADDPTPDWTDRPIVLVACGVIGVLGEVLSGLVIVLASALHRHGALDVTVSELGRGTLGWALHIAFLGNAISLLALAAGARRLNLGRVGWNVGAVALLLLAIGTMFFEVVGIVEASAISNALLAGLFGPLQVGGAFVMAPAAGRVSRVYTVLFLLSALGGASLLIAGFLVVPPEHLGRVEKLWIFVGWLWTVPLSLLFVDLGLQAATRR